MLFGVVIFALEYEGTGHIHRGMAKEDQRHNLISGVALSHNYTPSHERTVRVTEYAGTYPILP